jgi:hypothetical protein
VTALAMLAALLVAQGPEVPRVVPFHVVPSDLTLDVARLRLNALALEDVRQWYQRELGVSFSSEPLVVLQSRHSFGELAADDFQAWWPLLGQELADLGLPWNRESSHKVLLLVQGAGGWAGSDSENGGIERIADAGAARRGDRGGLALIGDSAVSGIVSGVCPWTGAGDGTVWWCNWETYRGTIAHELGHTFGLPHPDALRAQRGAAPWRCEEDGDTVLQCHWNFPADSLLDYERRHLRSLPFFRATLAQVHLAERLPVRAEGAARIHRLAVGPTQGRAIGWIDLPAAVNGSPRTQAVGFPSAAELGIGSISWRLDPGCWVFFADVGRARGTGGRGTATVEIDGRERASADVAAGAPQRIRADFCDAGVLTLRVNGERRFRALFGHPRLLESGGR